VEYDVITPAIEMHRYGLLDHSVKPDDGALHAGRESDGIAALYPSGLSCEYSSHRRLSAGTILRGCAGFILSDTFE
jgi:hypothetical protein